MRTECTKKVFYSGKLTTGEQGHGDSGDQRPVIWSIDWSSNLTHAIGTNVRDMLAVTGTGGTYVFQRKPDEDATDEIKDKDLEHNWIQVHHDGDLVGNVCRFANTSYTTTGPGTLAVATLPKEGVGSEVHMLTQVKDACVDDLKMGKILFKTKCFFRANFKDPHYDKKIINICWGHSKPETMLIFKQEFPKIHSLRWVYGSRNTDDSQPGYYWFRENFLFDRVNPLEEDILGCIAPIHNSFAACTENSVIKVFRKNEKDGPGGNNHWYGAGRVWDENDTGNILLSFSPMGTPAGKTSLAALKHTGDVTIYSFEVPDSIGDVQLVPVCMLRPKPGQEIPKYFSWTKSTVFWTCGRSLESLTLFFGDEIADSEWVLCSRVDRESTGIAPFNLVSGLCCNPKKKNSITWIGPDNCLHFLSNGGDYMQKVRNLLDERFSSVPIPRSQLIEFSTQYSESIRQLMVLLGQALSQSEDEHNRLLTVLEALAKILDSMYRGHKLDLQSCIEEIYEKGRSSPGNP